MRDTDPDLTAQTPDRPPDDRLESWKEIATYLGKDASTVQRWEKRAGLPVHRHADGSVLNVYAYRSELDAWQRQDRPLPSNRTDGADDDRAAGVLPDRGGDEPRPVSASIAFRRRHVSWVAAAAVLTVTVLGAAWVIQTRPHAPDTSTEIDLPFEQDDYVLITQFDNLTGEPRFDGRGTLEAVLELALSESGYLHVVQPERIEDTLRLMTLPVDSVIDRTVGREVARRDGGIRAVLAGSIEASGSGYVLTVQLVNPQDGRVLDSVTEEASSDEAGIASAIRRQAGRVREYLGEALPLIVASEQRLQKVTTPSMRAVHLYSRGYGVLRGSGSGKFAAAEELFRLAIREDPSFAAAHNMLGWSIHNQDTSRQPEEYLRHIERALELTGGTTESDRLFIEGSYFSLTKQWAKAAAKYEALLDLHPAHHYGLNNLRLSYARLRRPQRIEFVVRQADVRPNEFGRQVLAARSLWRVEQLAEARGYVERASALLTPDVVHEKPNDANDAAWLAFLPAYENWAQAKLDEAFTVVEEALAQSDTARSSANQALYAQRAAGSFYWAFGQLGKAKELFERLPERFRHVYLAEFADALDDHENFHEHIRAWTALRPSNRFLSAKFGPA